MSSCVVSLVSVQSWSLLNLHSLWILCGLCGCRVIRHGNAEQVRRWLVELRRVLAASHFRYPVSPALPKELGVGCDALRLVKQQWFRKHVKELRANWNQM
uniref:Secreted protein n=1 Tax=Knipowitschia caucasica TaxID=637954 RepID=A0AAV2LY84_KNICA